MPTYIYETIPADPHVAPRRFEVRQAMRDEPLTADPATGEPVRRVISGGLAPMTPRRTVSLLPGTPLPAGGHCCGVSGCGPH
jgi:hypothetical protein